jgi:hypothetical protein
VWQKDGTWVTKKMMDGSKNYSVLVDSLKQFLYNGTKTKRIDKQQTNKIDTSF